MDITVWEVIVTVQKSHVKKKKKTYFHSIT